MSNPKEKQMPEKKKAKAAVEKVVEKVAPKKAPAPQTVEDPVEPPLTEAVEPRPAETSVRRARNFASPRALGQRIAALEERVAALEK